MVWWTAPALLMLALFIYGLRIPDRYKLRHVPGPPWPWLVGNLLEMAKLGDFQFSHLLRQKHGPIYKVWALGGNVTVASPQMCREVLLHNTARFNMPKFNVGKRQEFDDASMLWKSIVQGEQAIAMRSSWQPMFQTGSLEGFVGLINQAAGRAVAALSAAAKSGEYIDIEKPIGNLAMQVIASTAFGLDVSDPEHDLMEGSGQPYLTSQLLQDVRTYFHVSFNPTSPYVQLALIFPFAGEVWRWLANILPDACHAAELDCLSRLLPYIDKLMRDHAASLDAEDAAAQPEAGPAEARHGQRRGVASGSFIDLLVRAKHRATGAGFTDIEICNQVFTMLLGGLETTASAIAFTIYCLSLHPDKAAQVRAELDGRPGSPSYSSLQDDFPYTEAALREAMRLYPPGVTALRELNRDTILGGYKVPQGTRVMASIYALHHDAAIWPDPEAYIPERHLSGATQADGAATEPRAWLGFGDGARSCVGSRLALLEAKLALINICSRFTFELQPGQVPLQLVNTISLRPGNGVWMRMHARAPDSGTMHHAAA